MTQHPVVLAIALAFATSFAVSGCDRTASLTEQEHIQRAKDFEDKGNLKGSIVELKNAVQKNPDSPQARLLLGQIYLKVGLGAEAEKELSRAKALGVAQEAINPELGEALLLTGEYSRLLEDIQVSERSSKINRARVLTLRADALIRLGKLGDACTLYRQSLEVEPNHPPTLWGLATCSVADRDFEKARHWIDLALQIPDRQARSWVISGDLRQLENDAEGSIEAYSNALRLDPDNLKALSNRGSINTTLGRLEPARNDIERIRKLAPRSFEANYLYAFLTFKEGKYPEARGAIQETLKLAPNQLPALLLAGMIEYSLGNFQSAESHLNKFVRAQPRNGLSLRLLASTQLRLGRPDDAQSTLSRIDFDKVKDPALISVAGEIALAKQDFAKAAEFFERAADLDPENSAIRTELGVSRLAQGDEQAMAELQAASRMQGASARADNIIILDQLRKNQLDAALKSIDALEKKQPKNPLTWNYRGFVYLGKNDSSSARRSFEQALKLDPRFFPAAFNLARLDVKDGQTANARKRFESILKTDPANIKAMLALADLSLGEKDERSYLSWLERALKTDPKSLAPREAMTRHFLGKGETNKAIAIAQETVHADPENPAALNLLGRVQLAAGDKANAVTTFTTMTKKASQSPEAYFGLALAHIANDDPEKARAALQTTLTLAPAHLPSLDALSKLELTTNKSESALRIAQSIQTQHPRSPIGFEREGDVYLSQKRFTQAGAAYDKALANGAGSRGMMKLHRAMTLGGNGKLADERLSGWTKQHPSDAGIRVYAADSAMFKGRDREAIAHYEAALQLEPSNAKALNNLANLYLRTGDDRAIKTAEQALKLAPEHPGVLDTLGWILVEKGQVLRGLGYIRSAVGKAPSNPTIRYHLAVALARNGEKAQARTELEKALSSQKAFPEKTAANELLRTL